MTKRLSSYEGLVSATVLGELRQLGGRLAGKRVVHVNSTREGGGVAEILGWMVPLMQDVGLDAHWEVIAGNSDFYGVTKKFHNGLQGFPVTISKREWQIYQQVNEENAARLRPLLEDADFVVIHDPQPAALLDLCPNRKGKWIWRGHIDISRPNHSLWRGLRPYVSGYDASIFSMCQFAQPLPHPQFLIPPSIDPLSPKNMDLDPEELTSVRHQYNLAEDKPLLVQVSRFDRFKDPLGVLAAYRLIQKVQPVQLVLAGGGASDDPEGQEVLEEVLEATAGDPDVHVLLLPANAHRTINALQRLADIVIQKSTREGFGLTVTEGLWKGKPVIGGDTGGIRLQLVNYHTGFLVNSPEGAAHRIRFLLHHEALRKKMGDRAREYVREHFLLTRHLREYLTLFHILGCQEKSSTLFV